MCRSFLSLACRSFYSLPSILLLFSSGALQSRTIHLSLFDIRLGGSFVSIGGWLLNGSRTSITGIERPGDGRELGECLVGSFIIGDNFRGLFRITTDGRNDKYFAVYDKWHREHFLLYVSSVSSCSVFCPP